MGRSIYASSQIVHDLPAIGLLQCDYTTIHLIRQWIQKKWIDGIEGI